MNLKERTKRIEKACKSYIAKKEEVLANRKILLPERTVIMDNYLSYLCSDLGVRKSGIKTILLIK